MVRVGILITGIILLVLAAIAFQIPVTNTGYTIPGANNLCNTDFARLGQLFSGDLQQICGQYQLMLYGIYGLAIVGIILVIVGATIPRSFQKSESKYICGYCKYVAESERELHNHSLNCEEYEKEIGKEKNNAQDILKERYAKGEITKEEFDKMKEDLL